MNVLEIFRRDILDFDGYLDMNPGLFFRVIIPQYGNTHMYQYVHVNSHVYCNHQRAPLTYTKY